MTNCVQQTTTNSKQAQVGLTIRASTHFDKLNGTAQHRKIQDLCLLTEARGRTKRHKT